MPCAGCGPDCLSRPDGGGEVAAWSQARVQPTTNAQVIEYLLSTEGDEMNFEVARTRPLLTPEFFDYLQSEISASPLLSTDLVSGNPAFQAHIGGCFGLSSL